MDCGKNSPCGHPVKFWVQRDSANVLVCGVHVTRAVVGLAAMDETAHPSYHIRKYSTVTVKVRQDREDGVFYV